MRLVSFRVCVITAEGKYDDMLCQIARLLISDDGRLETNQKKNVLKRRKYNYCAAKWKNPLSDVSLLEEAAVVAVKVSAASLPNILLEECCFFFLFELSPARVLTVLMKPIREPHGSCSTRNRNTVPLFSR